jgi:hypothetical protein
MKTQFHIIKHCAYIISFLICLTACNFQMGNPAVSQLNNTATINNDSIHIGEVIIYKNLQVFPILGLSDNGIFSFIALADAIKYQKAIVKETGSVNQLQIDNLSDDYIFILAGDIVKGGRQDRTMGSDVIIAPKAKNVPLESFCVESGRWQKRGGEESDHFSDNSKILASKDLKLASRYEKNQSKVWQKVAEEQEHLNKNLSHIKGENVDVKSAESGSSLQLTLENKELEDFVKEYRNNLTPLYQLPANTIGFAYAINGELFGADIFHNNILFSNLKSKLFDAIIVEAISEFKVDSNYDKIGTDSIVGFLNSFDKTAEQITKINPQTMVLVYETNEAVKFETRLGDPEERWIHSNYLVKGESPFPNK